MDQDKCPHIWTANSGNGGDPRFNTRMVGDVLPVMHVKCLECGTRAFFTEKQWFALDEAQEPISESPEEDSSHG